MNIKSIIPHFLSILIIVLFSAVYFSPQLSGKKVSAGDAISSTAWSKQTLDYKERTGETARWNPSMFSGMPWGLLTLGYEKNLVAQGRSILSFFTDPPMGMFISGSLITYLVLILLGINSWIALLMSLCMMYNSNFLVLIEAGHWNKLLAITYFPLILGAVLLAWQEKYMRAFLCMAIGINLSIFSNHIQMVYYLMLLMVLFTVILAIDYARKKHFKNVFIAGSILLAGATLGALSNFSQLYSSQSFSKHTMRGEQILTNSDSNQPTKKEGLKWDYAMRWSNETNDLFSLTIPRAVGSSSSEDIPANTKLGRLMLQNGAKRHSGNEVSAPLYWGNLDFTSGSYYIGVSLFLLFILSFFINPKSLTLAFASALTFGFLLSMGKNVEWVNHFLFEYFPLFSKFRTPNSIMNILPMFFVFPAALGLNKLLFGANKNIPIKKYAIYSVSIVAVLNIGYYLMVTSNSNFISDAEVNRYNDQIIDIFTDTRKALLTKDVLRSLFITGLVFGVLYLFISNKISKALWIIGGLALIMLFDVVTISKRYLDSDNFVTKRGYDSYFSEKPFDKQILALEPKGRCYYRVYNQTQNTFNDARQAYYHNTIGGYHAAKLLRYQDIIDRHLSRGNMKVFNMLNTKYLISKNGQLQINNNALGNAWFVNDLQIVNTPEEEINALNNIDPQRTAVILENDFKNKIPKVGSGTGNIQLISCDVNEWEYQYETPDDQLVVFSEVWYPQEDGFIVEIDGQPVYDMVRVNYILRALSVPAGSHTIRIKFDPSPKFPWVSLLASLAILLSLFAGIIIKSPLKEKLNIEYLTNKKL